MYKQHQQGLAVVLLTGFFLQSCGDNLTGVARSSLQVDRSTQNKNEESPQKEREQQHHPTPSMLAQEKLPSMKNTQTGDKNPSYSFPPTDPLKRTHPTSIDTGRQQHKTRKHILKNRSALADKIASTTLPLASLAPTEETAQTRQQAVCPLDCRQQQTANSELTAQAFTTAMGEQVRLQRIGKELWQAYVTDQIGPSSRTRCLPLVYEAHSDPQAVLTTLRAHPQRARQLLHILPTKGKIPHHPWVVHVGPLGLMGGMIRATQGEQGAEEEKRDSQAAQQEQSIQRQRLVYQGQALSIFFKEAFNDPAFLPDAIATFKGVAQVAPKRAGKYIALLKRALHNPDSGICCAALDALGALVEADPSFAPVLIEWIKTHIGHSPPEVFQAALLAQRMLVQAAPSEALREMLLRTAWVASGTAFMAAVDALGELVKASPVLAEEELFTVFLKALTSTSPPDMCCTAIEATGKLAQAAPVLANTQMRDCLLSALSHRNETDICCAAGNTFEKLAKANPHLVSQAVLDYLIRCLEDDSPLVIRASLGALREIAKGAPATIGAVYQREQERRKAALEERNEEVAELRKALEELQTRRGHWGGAYTQPDARQARGEVIGQYTQLRGRLSQLSESEDAFVRCAVANVLESFVEAVPGMADTEMRTMLLRTVEDEHEKVRHATVKVLTAFISAAPGLANPQIRNQLVVCADNPERFAYIDTINALGALLKENPSLANVAVLSRLLIAAESSSPDLRRTALKALGYFSRARPGLSSKRVYVVLDENVKDTHLDRRVRSTAITALGLFIQAVPTFAEQVTKTLADTVRDTSTVVRCVSMQTLGQLAQVAPSCKEAALALLSSATEDANEEVCSAAIEAIEQVRMVQRAT